MSPLRRLDRAGVVPIPLRSARGPDDPRPPEPDARGRRPGVGQRRRPAPDGSPRPAARGRAGRPPVWLRMMVRFGAGGSGPPPKSVRSPGPALWPHPSGNATPSSRTIRQSDGGRGNSGRTERIVFIHLFMPDATGVLLGLRLSARPVLPLCPAPDDLSPSVIAVEQTGSAVCSPRGPAGSASQTAPRLDAIPDFPAPPVDPQELFKLCPVRCHRVLLVQDRCCSPGRH